ncbi:MAG: DUF1501 domain-containing protein [Planctomycetota bacterium]|nr:MAG: DUF1501 domain-containing protein [Planctomycetota bacterium]
MQNPTSAHPHHTRRHLLRTGTAGVLGMSLPQLLATESQLATASAAAKRVIVIYEQGGLSHLDTWDPKPEAVLEHRSPFAPIATTVPGMQFTSLLSRTAKIAHKLAVVRSMHHNKAGADAHPNGTQYALSGAHPSNAVEMPDMGCVVTKLLGRTHPSLPPYVMIPGNHEQAAETRTGFLPRALSVFKTGGQDLSDPKWEVADLLARSDNQGSRLSGRHQLLSNLDHRFSNEADRTSLHGMDQFYEQAFNSLTSREVSAAFDLNQEPEQTREQYGRGHRGSCYLLGRRLLEAGVRFVTVDVRWPLTPETPGGFNLNWDHHDLIYTSASCGTVRDKAGGEGRYGIGHWVMMGSTDQAFAALVTDLDERGLLDETLVCFVTEFGRTPRLNKFAGRDHWTNAYSIAFAGAGVPGGQVIGESDRDGGYVISQAYTPEDYATTIYEKLGIDRSKPLYTSANRPVYFGHLGHPMKELF